jgi:hypothetical protein
MDSVNTRFCFFQKLHPTKEAATLEHFFVWRGRMFEVDGWWHVTALTLCHGSALVECPYKKPRVFRLLGALNAKHFLERFEPQRQTSIPATVNHNCVRRALSLHATASAARANVYCRLRLPSATFASVIAPSRLPSKLQLPRECRMRRLAARRDCHNTT